MEHEKTMSNKTESSFQRASTAISSRVENDTVILSAEQGKYFTFGPVGTLVWERLAEPLTLSELVDCVRENYHVDREICRSDISSFLWQLKSARLIEEKFRDA